ncbi:MAG: ABC transporter permease [Acidimicrobiaceae bacterium]|nr:ABC transporter permease [Chloroflexota bacterium]MYB27977.1 ABC transporter permease [Acidimicrobiaceae bacterium]
MGRYSFVLKRLLISVPLLLGVVFLVFLLLKITPGDPARVVAGLRASEEAVDQVRDELGLNDPVIVQYATYVGDVARGDFGYSFKSRQPVTTLIKDRLEPSLWLVAGGLAVSIAASIPLANWAAARRDGLADQVIRGVSLLGVTMPAFWVGLMLIILVALPTGWFPTGGFGDTAGEHLHHIVLPAATLGISLAPIQIRSLRASTIRVLDSDYVQLGRSIGAHGSSLVRWFVLRNTVSSTVTIIAIETSFLLFGMVVIETTFSLPGLGQGMVLAASQRDFPAIQGYTLLFALIVVAVYLLADVINAMLDPRVEISG